MGGTASGSGSGSGSGLCTLNCASCERHVSAVFLGSGVKGVLGQLGLLEAVAVAVAVVVAVAAPELLALLQVEVRGEQEDGW